MLSRTAYDTHLMSVGVVARPSSANLIDRETRRSRTSAGSGIPREYRSLFLPLLSTGVTVLEFDATATVFGKSVGIVSAACVISHPPVEDTGLLNII